MYNNINNGVTDIPHISIHLFHHYQQIYNAGSYVVSKRSFVTKKKTIFILLISTYSTQHLFLYSYQMLTAL